MGSSGSSGGPIPDASISATVGALTRNEFAAGLSVTGGTIVSGDAGGHWTVSGGRLYPSPVGDAADLNAGPYALKFNDGSNVNVIIEPGTWDVTDQTEWDFVAKQPSGTLAGKKIALRNAAPLTLGITGVSGTPFRRLDLRDGGGNPLVVEGRFGEVGAWDDYCEIDRVQQLRGARGLTFRHLRTSKTNLTKFQIIGESSFPVDDIIIEDCDVSGQVADPNGDYSTSSNYPNRNIDLITTGGSVSLRVGKVTVRNCRVRWGANLINLSSDADGGGVEITGNDLAYFYNDAAKVSMGTPAVPNPVAVSDNFIHDPMGLPTDSDAQHPDAIQVSGNIGALADWIGIVIERNIIIPGTARGVMQSIFVDDMKTSGGDSGFFFTATIRNNLVSNNVAQGIWVAQAKNCVIENNTVVAWNQAANSTVSILVGTGTNNATNGGGNTVTDNIADSLNIVGGSTEANNFIAGRNGIVFDYAELFDGPDFNPATKSEAKIFFNPKVTVGASIA